MDSQPGCIVPTVRCASGDTFPAAKRPPALSHCLSTPRRGSPIPHDLLSLLLSLSISLTQADMQTQILSVLGSSRSPRHKEKWKYTKTKANFQQTICPPMPAPASTILSLLNPPPSSTQSRPTQLSSHQKAGCIPVMHYFGRKYVNKGKK